jgi:tol-pal system protein YbgF
MKTTLIITLTLVSLSFALAVPDTVVAQNREHQQLSADMRMLQEQTQQLAITLSALSAALSDALRDLSSRLDQANDFTLKGFADQRLIVDAFGTDLRVIRERVDETNVRVSTLGQEIDALRTTIPLIAQRQTNGVDGDAVNGPDSLLASGVDPSSSAVGLSPTRMYETAFADYAAGQWSLAITGFEAFLRTFSMSEQADDAQFYVGETYFNQNLMPEAVIAYNRVIDNYSSVNSTSLAYYKRGLAQERLGQLDNARSSWEQVVADYPTSDAGRLALQNLDRLNLQEQPSP